MDSLRVSTTRLANGETPVFSTGYFLQYEFAELIYEQTPDGLTEYWLTSKIKLSELTDGNLSITRDVSGNDLQLEISPANIVMDNTSDASLSYITLGPNRIRQRYHSNFLDVINGVMSLYNLAGTYQSDLSDQVLTIGNGSTPTDYVRVRAEASGGSYIQTVDGPTGLDTYVTGKGIKYVGEGVQTNKEHRWKAFSLSGIAVSTPTNAQVGYRVFPGGIDTGIVAADTIIKNGTIRYLDTADKYVAATIAFDASINLSLKWAIDIQIPVDVNHINGAKTSGGFVVDMIVWLDYYFV